MSNTAQILKLDLVTGTVITIDNAHHEVHNEDSFYVKDWMDLTNAQVFNFLLVTSNTNKWVHMVINVAFEGEAHIEAYEGTIASNNGTPVLSYNRNRNSIKNATTLLYHTPTVAGGSEGTLITAYKAGSTKQVGGAVRSESELVLKQNTKYLIRITNDTVSSNWVDYSINWYEHANIA
jgi:hypothetical protein